MIAWMRTLVASSRPIGIFWSAWGISVDMDLRLRYEVWREFAPYIGLSWSPGVVGTADLARTEETPIEDWSLLTGVRLWF